MRARAVALHARQRPLARQRAARATGWPSARAWLGATAGRPRRPRGHRRALRPHDPPRPRRRRLRPLLRGPDARAPRVAGRLAARAPRSTWTTPRAACASSAARRSTSAASPRAGPPRAPSRPCGTRGRDLPGGLVDLGGDLALWGRPPEGGRWRIAVADPRTPGGTLATLEVVGGGVATSGRDRRRFGPGGSLHHLIDPSTGAPARGGPLAVTVAGRRDAAGAEVHASAPRPGRAGGGRGVRRRARRPERARGAGDRRTDRPGHAPPRGAPGRVRLTVAGA